jgi:hypothetical protein
MCYSLPVIVKVPVAVLLVMPGENRHWKTLTTGDTPMVVMVPPRNGPDTTWPEIVVTTCPASVAVVDEYV